MLTWVLNYYIKILLNVANFEELFIYFFKRFQVITKLFQEQIA